MERFKTWCKKEWAETKLLFKELPAVVMCLYTLVAVSMNVLASTQLVSLTTESGVNWFALDAGIFVSWVMFMLGDMIVKRFGAKAAIKVAIFGMVVNLIFCGVITGIAAIMEATGSSLAYLGDYVLHGFSLNAENFDGGIATAWHIILGSALAFIVSATVNALVHRTIKAVFKKNPDGLGAHIASAWGSTAIGQFVDNLIFAFAVSIWIFGWQPLAAVMCAVTGMVVELLCQAIFTPVGYRIAESWRKSGIGSSYLEALSKEKEDINGQGSDRNNQLLS